MKKSHLMICLLAMLLAAIATYCNHFYNAFQFDDAHTIVNNVYIRDIHNLPLFFKDGTTSSTLPANQAYRPLVTASLALDYWLGNGYNLFYFHLSSFLLFLVQAVLLMFLFKKLLGLSWADNKTVAYVSVIAASWYTLHPAIAETVNYVIARSDIQSTFFVVLAFILFIYSGFCRKYLLYLVPLFIGGLAKPPVVMFAPILFFYILFFEEKMAVGDLFKKAHSKQRWIVIKKTVPAFIACLFTYWFINKMTPEAWQPGGTSPWLYLITQPFVILHYFTTFFVPNGLSADSDWQLLTGIADYRFFIGCLFIAVMIALVFYTSKKAWLRPISFGIVWFFLALVPTSSIIPLGEVLNDHRMYFPFIGLALAVTWSIALLVLKYIPVLKNTLVNYRIILAIAIVTILSVYAFATNERNKVWHTTESLWKDVTVKSPDNPRGQMNYGLALMARGDYQNAIGYYSKTLEKWPYYAYAYINMAIAKNAIGDVAAADDAFKKALNLNPNLPDAYAFYARFLMDNRRNAEARPFIEKGLSISPQFESLLQSKMQNDAILSKVPNTTIATSTATGDAQNIKAAESYINSSLQYYNSGQFEKCIEAAEQALKLNPNYDLAYNNICAAYNRLQNWDKAIEAGEKGLKINPNNQLLKNNLQESYKRGSK